MCIRDRADLSLQAEAVPEVTAGRAASLEESDYKGFAGQIQKVFSERDIEALSRLCAYPVYVTTEANTEGQDVADAAALISQKDDICTEDVYKRQGQRSPPRSH